MNVVVNGLMTSYKKTGQGKSIVLIHGWEAGNATFDQLSSSLKSDYEILALDLPGFGGTEAPKSTWGLDEYADFVKSWLIKIDRNQIYALIGHSNGGAISIKAVSQSVIKPNNLVLLASSGIRNLTSSRKNILKFVSKTGKIVTYPLSKSTKKNLRNKLYSKTGSDITVFPHMEDTFKKIVSQDIQQDAKKIKVPTLIIYGSKDKETPLLFGKIINQEIEGSRLETINDTGHFLHQEQAQIVAQLIKTFFKNG